jgi:hypothetical protein
MIFGRSQPCDGLKFVLAGGDADLARLLATQTILAKATSDETFWGTVIAFLIRQSPLSASEVLDIVQFIHRQRFEPASHVWRWGAGAEPLQPEFTVAGRSWQSLRRHMAHWESDLLRKQGLTPPAPRTVPWQPTEIGPFRTAVGDAVWMIEELLTPKDLRLEGMAMEHCVARYRYACASRRTSIWSMKVQEGDQVRRVLTVEVIPATRRIQQAKGPWNAAPTAIAQAVLKRWAHQESLRF